MNSALLDAAREVDALTYDLAAEVIPRSNGPEGGTPEGSRLVANVVRPVLHRLPEPHLESVTARPPR
jgi:hypothetical protein